MGTLDRIAPLSATYPCLSRTQQVVLEYVAAVPNLRDEEDAQHLLFLADEFALLRPNPFYFSAQHAGDTMLPCSLVLRDTLNTLLDRGLIGRGQDSLYVYSDMLPRTAPHSALAWLAALSPIERAALAQAALMLRTQGLCAHARSAGDAFRKALGQMLDGEATEALMRQLPGVRACG
jgi:hypothetical protein